MRRRDWKQEVIRITIQLRPPIPFPDNLEQQEIEVQWSPMKTDPLGNELILSGKLRYINKAGTAMPLGDQPFSIYLARQHEKRLDWSKKASYDETMMVDGLSDENGNFVGSANLSETDLSLDQHANVQIAIAAANVKWNGRKRWVHRRNDQPAIQSSVAMLELPPTPKLAPATFELNRLRQWPEHHLDGTQLLRTAMSLQEAGKDGALDAINTFIEGRIVESECLTGDLVDECVVGMITHLVFEPNEGSPLPPSYICLFEFEGRADSEALTKIWPNGSVMSSGGIPF
ncbi:MAG: hypothetical protein AAF989_11360, partial [Planctomycetota bacterium]